MNYYSQIVFKENGKIAAVTPIISVKALSKSMAKRKITKKCDFILDGRDDYEIVFGDKLQYKAKIIFTTPTGVKKYEKEITSEDVSFEIAEFKSKLQMENLSKNPILELLDINAEIIWEE